MFGQRSTAFYWSSPFPCGQREEAPAPPGVSSRCASERLRGAWLRGLQRERAFHRHPVAKRVEHDAVALSILQQPPRPFRPTVVFHADTRLATDVRKADRRLAVHAERAAQVQLTDGFDLQRLELDAHGRGDHAQGDLLARRQRAEQQITRARHIAQATHAWVGAGLPGDVGRRSRRYRAVERIGQIALAALHPQRDPGLLRVFLVGCLERSLQLTQIYARCRHRVDSFRWFDVQAETATRPGNRSRYTSASWRSTTSPYLASISNRFAMWGSSARSPTASWTTIVCSPSEHASTAVARTHPLVVHPVISNVSIWRETSRAARSVPKKHDAYFFTSSISRDLRSSRSSSSTHSEPSTSQLLDGILRIQMPPGGPRNSRR